ncbi:hypothetical protein [Salipaludibacillus aurantiacus]|uniref:Uncharacterized protein n=1 Tax=Salipaludibacillus aurantiacus TaxID=1601833 RepID=A0A1H9X617_9BACI|nr:hypothetical protein [Salipaludibacillus aurantiacus]SES41582.1 hypothetical protein SAMN05518684_12629 [Salipaludibacillus aurantiacus]
MKKSLGFLLELTRIIFTIFLVLLAFSLVNSFILGLIGGLGQFEGTWTIVVYFFMQTGGLFLLITLLYRNKLQFSGWYNSENQKPFSKKMTRRLLIISLAAVAGSYAILIAYIAIN